MKKISKIDTWSEEDRYYLLKQLDGVLSVCAAFYPYHEIWGKYGGGKKGTKEETEKNRREIAQNDEKFYDAIYAFIISILYDRNWEYLQLEEKGNEK